MSAFTTIEEPSGPILIKDRKSKFIGFAYPVTSVAEAKQFVQELHTTFPDATHVCFAYKIGMNQPEIRMNDDGEPTYSAGAPILGQLEAFGLLNVLVCVVRYYGGTKLGVGGLIQAYRETAKQSLENATLISVTAKVHFRLEFGYQNLDAVMRVISQNRLEIINQEMTLSCNITVEANQAESEIIPKLFSAIPELKLLHLPQ